MCICRHPISIRGLWLRSWTRFWSIGSPTFGRNWWMLGFQLWSARRAGSRSAPFPASGIGSRDRRSPDAGTLGRCTGDSCRFDRLSTKLDHRRLWGTNRLMGSRRCCRRWSARCSVPCAAKDRTSFERGKAPSSSRTRPPANWNV